MPSPKSVLPKSLRKADAPDGAATPARNVLRMELGHGRLAEMHLPMDLTEIEALQILGALPPWILVARADWLRRTSGGRIILPS